MKKPILFVTTVLFDDGSSNSLEVYYEDQPVEGYLTMPADEESTEEYMVRTTLRKIIGTT